MEQTQLEQMAAEWKKLSAPMIVKEINQMICEKYKKK